MEGFKVGAGIDSDKSCEFAFSTNNRAKFICKDINDIEPKEIGKLFPAKTIKILVGCAPCQPFSRYTSGVKTEKNDNKWSLLNSFANIIEAIQPEIISMENVPQLAKYNKKGVYSEFIKTLRDNGYFIVPFWV